MKKLPLFLGVVLLGLAGCATPESRVKQNETVFNSWPADVQARVRAGRIAVGDTQAMVQVALGEADRVLTRTTAQGVAAVWVYFDHSPRFSLGFGMGMGSRHSAVGGGVVVGDDGWRDEETMRVVFDGDKVSAIEMRK